MKIAAILATAGALAAGALAAGSLHVTLTAAGHSPKAGAHWPYAVHASLGGKAARARVTVQIVDPLGGKHPVGFGAKKGNVTRIAFRGTFRDFVIWPKTSVGFPLTFRVTVTAGKAKRVVNYTVTVKK
ncbi:MAG TPA: hypothetical protein VFA19_06305 [Gaiellaceae bacterium]|nr:hypothetical protein [Gaiellaceae bacterium]